MIAGRRDIYLILPVTCSHSQAFVLNGATIKQFRRFAAVYIVTNINYCYSR